MLSDAHGQSYFSFIEPCDVVVLSASLSQSVGSVKPVDRLECKVDPSSLHNRQWEFADALPVGPIMMAPFNSSVSTTDTPVMSGNSFLRGLEARFGSLQFKRNESDLVYVLFSPDELRVFGFDGSVSRRRSVSSLSISEAVTRLMRRGYRSVTGVS